MRGLKSGGIHLKEDVFKIVQTLLREIYNVKWLKKTSIASLNESDLY